MTAESGFLRRLFQPRISDLLLGLNFYIGRSSAFAELTSRPAISEVLATDFAPWPGRTAEYDADGFLRHPDRALLGQNVLVGLALSYAEVRALLAGLTQPRDVTQRLAAQYFRAGRGLATVLAELAQRGGLQAEQYVTAFWRLFFGPCIRAITDSEIPDDGNLYVAKRLASGYVALAKGDADEDGDDVIGVFARPGNVGDIAIVVTAGGFVPGSNLPAGKLYRAPDASLKPYAQLADGSSTTFIGIGSALGLDVRAIQAEEVDHET